MPHVLARPLTALRTSRTLLVAALVLALACSATGFGATEGSRVPQANVLGTIALTDPVAKSADHPVCTAALAPLDTDDCTDTTFTAGGASRVLNLGSLSGTDVQAGSLTWRVSTTSTTGYRVRMSNAGAAPMLRTAEGAIPDMSTTSLLPAEEVAKGTHFGVALGDAATDAEAAVSFPGSPWVVNGQQAERFSGIPADGAGMLVAERTSAQNGDAFTATFAAAAVAGKQPPTGAYDGTVRVTASII